MSRLHRASRVEAPVEPHRWAWAEENRELVAAHWRKRVAERPALFNGRSLLVSAVAYGPEVVRARFFETDYANLTAWHDHGRPGEPVLNGYAMGALLSSDGRYVLGRMGPHTANAGRLYFPCGTPDPNDIGPDGAVDLSGSIRREIREETGLDDLAIDPGWTVIEAAGLLAFMQVVRLPWPAETVRARIEAFLAREAEPELSGVEVVADLSGIDEAVMPATMPIFLRDAFGKLPPSFRGAEGEPGTHTR